MGSVNSNSESSRSLAQRSNVTKLRITNTEQKPQVHFVQQISGGVRRKLSAAQPQYKIIVEHQTAQIGFNFYLLCKFDWLVTKEKEIRISTSDAFRTIICPFIRHQLRSSLVSEMATKLRRHQYMSGSSRRLKWNSSPVRCSTMRQVPSSQKQTARGEPKHSSLSPSKAPR